MMRIVYIYDVIYPDTIGGVEKRIHEIGLRLHRMGHDVHLYGMKFWSGPDTITREGIVLHGVCPKIGLYTEGRRSIYQALRYTIGLIRNIINSDADIIDCQNFPYFPAIAIFIISLVKKQKMIVTWHEYWGDYWYQYLGKLGIFGRIIERITLLCSPSVLAVSSLTASQIEKAGYSGNILISPNGIHLPSFNAVSKSEKDSDIIFTGRFIPEKHPELVVEAIRLLSEEGISLRCIMVGDGPEFGSVRFLIEQYGLSGQIECTGFIEDYTTVISLMKASKIFILPSEREGFGIAAIEAMACGLALITTDHPRNAAVSHVLPGNGYLARIDATDIASGIKYCLNTPVDEEEISRYIRSHDWDHIAKNLESYYASLLASGNVTMHQKRGDPTGNDLTGYSQV